MRWIFAGGAQETENSGAGFVQMHLCAEEIWGINASHPAWGEWIEIHTQTARHHSTASHPAWGEWIEMSQYALRNSCSVVSPRMG